MKNAKFWVVDTVIDNLSQTRHTLQYDDETHAVPCVKRIVYTFSNKTYRNTFAMMMGGSRVSASRVTAVRTFAQLSTIMAITSGGHVPRAKSVVFGQLSLMSQSTVA